MSLAFWGFAVLGVVVGAVVGTILSTAMWGEHDHELLDRSVARARRVRVYLAVDRSFDGRSTASMTRHDAEREQDMLLEELAGFRLRVVHRGFRRAD
jgi:hypothetical protein